MLALHMRFNGFERLQHELVVQQQIYFFISSFFVAGASTIYKIVSDWLLHQREVKQLETQTMQSELKFLKSQINPHFLFNTLNNLYALTLKKSDKAPEIVLKLSEMMRYMLYECNEKKVRLEKEVNYLKNYLDLESLRQHDNVRIDLKVNGHIKDQQLAPLLFIPFIENSFKHGLNNQIKEGFVDIVLNVHQKQMQLKIINSKAQHSPQTEFKRSGGIGLVNVRRRLKILYPKQHNLDINETPNTYEITLDLTF